MSNIGLDIGGTNIRVGMMDDDNEFIYQSKCKNEYEDAYGLVSKVANMIEEIPSYQDADGIGISIAGSINPMNNRIVTAKNLPYLVDYPLTDVLHKIYGKPIVIENDAKVATYGEALEGFGKRYNTVCYITISTGLGGGIVINKEIYKGSSNFGAYFPRMYLDGESTADALISGRSLLLQAKEKINNNIDSNKELFDLYKEGNEGAIEIVENFKHYLTILLLNISATFNPDIIILGGGIVKSKDAFMKDVATEYYMKVHKLAKYTILTTQSLEEPGLVGACLLSKNKIKR